MSSTTLDSLIAELRPYVIQVGDITYRSSFPRETPGSASTPAKLTSTRPPEAGVGVTTRPVATTLPVSTKMQVRGVWPSNATGVYYDLPVSSTATSVVVTLTISPQPTSASTTPTITLPSAVGAATAARYQTPARSSAVVPTAGPLHPTRMIVGFKTVTNLPALPDSPQFDPLPASSAELATLFLVRPRISAESSADSPSAVVPNSADSASETTRSTSSSTTPPDDASATAPRHLAGPLSLPVPLVYTLEIEQQFASAEYESGDLHAPVPLPALPPDAPVAVQNPSISTGSAIAVYDFSDLSTGAIATDVVIVVADADGLGQALPLKASGPIAGVMSDGPTTRTVDSSDALASELNDALVDPEAEPQGDGTQPKTVQSSVVTIVLSSAQPVSAEPAAARPSSESELVGVAWPPTSVPASLPSDIVLMSDPATATTESVVATDTAAVTSENSAEGEAVASEASSSESMIERSHALRTGLALIYGVAFTFLLPDLTSFFQPRRVARGAGLLKRKSTRVLKRARRPAPDN